MPRVAVEPPRDLVAATIIANDTTPKMAMRALTLGCWLCHRVPFDVARREPHPPPTYCTRRKRPLCWRCGSSVTNESSSDELIAYRARLCAVASGGEWRMTERERERMSLFIFVEHANIFAQPPVVSPWSFRRRLAPRDCDFQRWAENKSRLRRLRKECLGDADYAYKRDAIKREMRSVELLRDDWEVRP